MKEYQICADDVYDVVELTDKLSIHIGEILKDNELNIAISSLMNITLKAIISQCDSREEALFYRNNLLKFFDEFIEIAQLP